MRVNFISNHYNAVSTDHSVVDSIFKYRERFVLAFIWSYDPMALYKYVYYY